MAIKVITFDLDNTLWDVEPALLRAEEAQQRLVAAAPPGRGRGLRSRGLWEFKKSVWKRHPQLLHHVSQMRIQMLYELQIAAGYPEEERAAAREQAFDVFLRSATRWSCTRRRLAVLELLASELYPGRADQRQCRYLQDRCRRVF